MLNETDAAAGREGDETEMFRKMAKLAVVKKLFDMWRGRGARRV